MSEHRLNPVILDNYKPLREIVFEVLRDAIIKQVLKPGERLMEIQLAEEMGVSRTPVREAIRKLELEGFVIMIPRKGAYVADISLKDISDVYEIRGALEALACGLAAERASLAEIEEMEKHLIKETEYFETTDIPATVEIDTGFHDLIYKAARNERLVVMLNNLREQIHRLRVTSIRFPGRLKKTLEEHRAIVEAISSRNVELAQKLGEEHIEHAQQALLELLKGKEKITP